MNALKSHSIFLLAGIALLLPGCGLLGNHSPTVDVFGSYFPAWIICILAGLALALVARQILIALKLNDHLYPGALVHLCLLIFFTLAVWLLFFKN